MFTVKNVGQNYLTRDGVYDVLNMLNFSLSSYPHSPLHSDSTSESGGSLACNRVYMKYTRKYLRDSVTRFFASSFFHESVSPQPQSIPFRPFQIFSKIHGDIRESRCTTGINDTGGKFATGVNDTGGKIAAGINTAGGKFATGIRDTGGKFFYHFR